MSRTASDKKAVAREQASPAQQFAVLPFRHVPGGGIEVLLITSLETRRWVLPKGWPMDGKSGCESAAQEAFEEAGIIGLASSQALGEYCYLKLRKRRPDVSCAVTVFPMLVTQLLDDWPEKTLRTLKWVSPEEAADMVAPDALGALIRDFGRRKAAA